jgi:hypothetical protein
MTSLITNLNLTLVSNATITSYRDRVIASGVALLAAYFVPDPHDIDKLSVPVSNHCIQD